MNRSQQLLILVLLLAAAVSACKTHNEPQSEAENSSTQIQQAAGGATTQGQTRVFKGSISDTLGLEMKLLREGDRLTGSYFYEKVRTKIDLRGTIDNAGNVALDEFDGKGKQTGTFKGVWKEDETGVIVIKGNWIKPNSDKKTEFYLREEPLEFSSGVEIVAKRITDNNKKLKYEIDAEYPQLTGSGSPNYEKFNQTIRTLVTKKVSSFKEDMAPSEEDDASESFDPPVESMGSDLTISYTVLIARDELISILLNVGSYSAGAAHPNSYSETVNFDLKNGRQLKLADLFVPGAKYLNPIASYCIADLKRQAKQQGDESILDEDWIQRGAGPVAENYQSWTISRKGLGVVFDAYQVAAYAAGPQHVFIPYRALKEIIRNDGPIGQLAN